MGSFIIKQKCMFVLVYLLTLYCCILTLIVSLQFTQNSQSASTSRNYHAVQYRRRHEICSDVLSEDNSNGDRFSASIMDKYAECISKLAQENYQAKRAFEKIGVSFPQHPRKRKYTDDVFLNNQVLNQSRGDDCQQHNCFDYSKCSLTSPFTVYFYGENNMQVDPFVRTSVSNLMKTIPYASADLNASCLYFVLIGDTKDNTDISIAFSNLQQLPSWEDTGRNHVILNLARKVQSVNIVRPVTSQAIIVQSTFYSWQFRRGFDIIAPMLLGKEASYDWHDTPLQVPVKRKYLLSFQGTLLPSETSSEESINKHAVDIRRELDILKTLQEPELYIDIKCSPLYTGHTNIDKSEWQLCEDKNRLNILKQSIYTLIIAPDEHVSSTTIQMRLFEALQHGVIPVILGEHILLPFGEFITWEKAAITLPKARVPELYLYLSSIQDGDILSMRRQGLFLWTTYFSSTKAVLNGILATLRTRLSLPAKTIRKAQSPKLFTDDFKITTKKVEIANEFRKGDFYPAPKGSRPSPQFQRNFTYLTIDRELSWNNFPGPFHLFPHTPFDPVLPTDVQFTAELAHKFEPLGNGLGARGRAFQESLGGNHPTEQFTIVMLSYERLPQILSLLNQINGLPYLNKVLVIWNSRRPPPASTIWPEIHVPFKVINSKKNSLNNRFLPYDEIETEAIMTVDEDITLNHDETILAFRVWREARDRIVGLPGRVHNWDTKQKGFMYGMTSSCEFSMVLTGSAFFHIYYAYVYSYIMPQVIRDKVDEYMNCEDISMNFLVAHISRKPPIKVTGRVYFVCPACRGGLSGSPQHYRERHSCIRFLTKIYGYTPLLFTQYRADTALFNSTDTLRCYNNA